MISDAPSPGEPGAGLQAYDWRQFGDMLNAVFRAAGSGEREAGLIADHLVEASLTGHDSHGVGLVPSYIQSAGKGDLVLNQTLGIFLDSGALCICDGGQGAGQVMAHDAMVLGIERANASGSCILGLRNSHHVGRIGHWAEQCAAAGLVSVHFVNVISDPMVVPFGGTAARLSTNPFAAGFPRGNSGPPVIVDFATSRYAFGKVRVAHNKGEPLPPGIVVDEKGRPTTDPSVMFADPMGALLPFGEHKGSALTLACELLGGALFGAATVSGPQNGGPVLNSMFSVLIDPAALGLGDDYAERQAAVAAWYGSETLADGSRVKLPGDPEREMREYRKRNGIPIDDTTMGQIRATATALGVTVPAPL